MENDAWSEAEIEARLRRGIFLLQLQKENGGAERDRTVDLLNAIQALSQLSYGPTGRAFLAEGDSIVNESVRMRRFGSAWGLVVSADFKSVGSAW